MESYIIAMMCRGSKVKGIVAMPFQDRFGVLLWVRIPTYDLIATP